MERASHRPDSRRVLDAQQHFLGVWKEGVLHIYCQRCGQFVRTPLAPTTDPPMDQPLIHPD